MKLTLIRYAFWLLCGLLAGYILSQVARIIELLQNWGG